jgi:AAA domain, putative AbiEii toxin, Type IV TA system
MEGLVLIDEIDLYLHPTWQVGFIRALRDTFPKLQFIATTHSPILLTGLHREEVLVLARDPESGDIVTEQPTHDPRLLTGSERQLAHAELRGRLPGRDDIKGYAPPEVRKQLCELQHQKCAYCEKGIEEEGYPIEHFRPKLGAEDVRWDQHRTEEPPPELDEVVWTKDPARYWWLAWTWENLFYSCPACNSRKYKGNRFPLRRGSPRLDPTNVPFVVEQPLLLDPAEVDPLDHIRFMPDYGEDNWRAIGLTLEGRWTILVLGLNRTGLRTDRKNHVRSVIKARPASAAAVPPRA